MRRRWVDRRAEVVVAAGTATAVLDSRNPGHLKHCSCSARNNWYKEGVLVWKDVLVALVSMKNNEGVLSLDVWVFDDVVITGWTKNRSYGPIELKVDRFLQRLQNGQIVGECLDEKLFVFDSEDGGVEEILIDEAKKASFQVCGYTKSLMYMKGMRKVVPPAEEEEKRTRWSH